MAVGKAQRERGGKGSHALVIVLAAAIILGASLLINYQHSLRHAVHLHDLQRMSARTHHSVAYPNGEEPLAANPQQQATAVAMPPQLENLATETATILVGISAYRDVVCQATIKEMYEKAKHPLRVFVSLIDQVSVEFPNEECVVDGSQPWAGNVRVMRISSDMSRGPVIARYFSSKLYRDEHFWFQIDSHMKFDDHWDSKVIDMWKERVRDLASTGIGEKVVLSHYPLAYNITSNQLPDEHTSHTAGHCTGFFNGEGIFQPRDWTIPKSRAEAVKLKPVPVAAAGMMFAPATILADVPYDPWLPHLFHGEELSYSVRAYEKGYKIYTPTDNIVYHFYGRSDRPKSWTDHTSQGYAEMARRSVQRVKLVLHMEEPDASTDARLLFELERYSVTVDTRLAWEKEFDISLTNGTKGADWC